MRRRKTLAGCSLCAAMVFAMACHPAHDGLDSKTSADPQSQPQPLQAKLATTRLVASLEGLSDRRGTWHADARIKLGEWVSLLNEPDAEGYVLVKPRAELDIVRRMHTSALDISGYTYFIDLPSHDQATRQCPVYSLSDGSALGTPSSRPYLLPADIASSYRWTIEPSEVTGFMSRYCANGTFEGGADAPLHHWAKLATAGALPLSDSPTCSAPECYGFELESTSYAIMDYYRASGFDTDAQWLTAPRQVQKQRLDEVLNGRLDDKRIGQRLQSAPPFLSPVLLKERSTIWEITSIAPQPSLEQMLMQMGIIKELFESRWSVHLHISFPLPPLHELDIPRIRQLVYLINEYLALRVYAHDVPAVLHPFTGPTTWESTSEAIKSIVSGASRIEQPMEFKYHFVALRCTDPYGLGRCGFEVRRTVAGLSEQITLLERLRDSWHSPTRVQLHNPVPLYLDPVGDPAIDDVLTVPLWQRFEKAEPELALMLTLAEDDPYGFTDTTLHERAMLPMINWEARIAHWLQQGRLSASDAQTLTQRVQDARVGYVAALQEAASKMIDPFTITEATPHQIALALHHWARNTALWRYY